MISLPILEIEVEGMDALRPIDMGAVKESVRRGLLLMAQHAQQTWTAIAQAEGLHDTGDYVSGITASDSVRLEVTDAGSSLVAELSVVNTSPRARMIEEGHGAFHLPDKIDWGNTRGSIKLGKNGPYLHIPFRHSAYASPGAREEKGYTNQAIRRMMPADVSAEAAGLRRRLKNNTGPHRNATTGRMQAADTYRWESGHHGAPKRLERPDTGPRFVFGPPGGEAGVEEWRSARLIGRNNHGHDIVNPAWKSSKFAGMMKTGPARHTSYLTIRTITPRSEGWWIPAVRGRFVLPKVYHVLRTADTLGKLFASGLISVFGPPEEGDSV